MRHHLLTALALAASVAAASPVPAAEQCATCHPETRVEFERSLHFREEIGCASCHGGDPGALDVERAHGGSFRSLGERLEVPAFCAECHADLDRMRPYNLPVDQYAVYQTSQHGRAVAGGDERAAVCTDCHGVHDIRAPEDPSSPVYRRNLPDTCGRCHAEAERMEDHGLDPGVVDQYRASVHGKALLEAGNLAAPNCTHCHGVHGATPPGMSDLDKICGACHGKTRAAFLDGPHHLALEDAGLPECVSCHDHHAIRRFEAGGIAGVCAECHGEGSEQAQTGEKMRTLIEGAEAEVAVAEEVVKRAALVPLDVEDHLGRIEEARTYLLEARPLVHSVSLEQVEGMTRRSRSIGKEVQHELEAELERESSHVGLAIFWFYLVMTLAVLVLARRRLAASGGAS